MDEDQIINLVCNGEADRYAALVEKYHIGLILHCDRIVRDRDEAEDIAQKAFIRAYGQLSTFDPAKAKYSTWIYKIATNLAFDYLRQRKRMVDTEDLEGLIPAYDPAYEKEDSIREIRKAVSNLQPPEHRKAIEAYYWEGKRYQVIADELGVPINTVKSWLRRAKQQLKEELS